MKTETRVGVLCVTAGGYARVSAQTTHTGHHVRACEVYDINEATVLHNRVTLMVDAAILQQIGDYKTVQARSTVTTVVEVLQEESASPESLGMRVLGRPKE